MWRIPGLSGLAVMLTLHSLAAQVCLGRQPFAGRPVQLWGFGTFTQGNHVGGYGGGVRLIGGRTGFGAVELGASHSEGYGGHSWLIGAGAGYQISLNQSGTVQLCPAATLGFLIGPTNIDQSGVNYHETDVGADLRLGVRASHTARFDVVPTATISFQRSHQYYSGSLPATSSVSASFEVLELALGLVHKQQLTVRPAFEIPVGLSGATAYLTVSLAYSFGTLE